MSKRLDDALTEAGRDPSELRRVLNVSGTISAGRSDGPLRGPVGQWTDELTAFALDYGFDTFIFWGEGNRQLDMFAQEVVPATRRALEAGSGPRFCLRPEATLPIRRRWFT
jgi:hypothetical protein